MMMNDDNMMIACHVCHACIQSMMHGRGQTQPAALAHDLAVVPYAQSPLARGGLTLDDGARRYCHFWPR